MTIVTNRSSLLALTCLLCTATLCLAQGNAGLSKDQGFSSYTSVNANHDSSSGWSTITTPSVRYDFNHIFGVEMGIPYYISHNGYDTTVAVRRNQVQPLVTSYNSLGDLYLSLNFTAPLTVVGYKATITGTAPTGDTSSGISTGRPTFDLNNHFDHPFSFFTPLVEFGIGDSSALIDKRVRRPYTTLGPLSHFRAGSSFDFLKIFSFEATAYEDLPIGDQKVFSHVLRRSQTGTIIRVGADGKKHRFQKVAVDTGQGILEDNGLTGSFLIKLGQHVDLLATYNRSLRQALDTVSFGVGYRFGKGRKPLS